MTASPFEKLALAGLHFLDAETAHGLTIKALKTGLMPKCPIAADPRLEVQLWDLRFPNPVGMAAEFRQER